MEPARSRNHALWAVVGLALAYAALFRDRGWIPHDEGLLGQSAERVLLGQLPHLDFDDPYTGGLSFLHAAVFAVLGTQLANLRLLLLVCFCAATVLTVLMARRLTNPALASALGVLCVVWTLPNYFAPLPSWYNLFFTLAGTYALMRFFESGRWMWSALAGLAGGLACLIKITGLYFLIPAALAILYVEQEQQRSAGGPAARPFRASSVVISLVAAGITAFLTLLIRRNLGPETLLHFVFPGAACAAYVAWNEWHLPSSAPYPVRLAAQLRALLPCVLGAAIPMLLLVGFYAAHDGVDELIRGVIILPQRRIQSAQSPLPPLWSALVAVPFALALWRRSDVRTGVMAGAGALLVALLTLGSMQEAHRISWYSLRPLIPAAVVAAGFLVRKPLDTAVRARLFLLVGVAAFASMLQYPYASGIYFCYAAPLVVLAWTAIAAVPGAEATWRATTLQLVVPAFYALFAVAWVNTGTIRTIGMAHWPVPNSHFLDAGRAELWVPAPHRAYDAVVAAVREHGGPDAYIYAGPDCPEIYFLTGKRNPTRTFYDFMDEPQGRVEQIVQLLETHNVHLAVINRLPEFSGAMDPLLEAELVKRFPNSAQYGPFQVLWKQPTH